MLFLPPYRPSADAGGDLTAGNEKVTVTLTKPQEEPEPIHSLRFWLTVSATEGEMRQPTFTFSETVLQLQQPEGVCSAKVSGQDGTYVMDIILAFKNKRNIFAEDNVVIGTVDLQPSGGMYRVHTAFCAPSADGGQPVMRYINDSDLAVKAVPLTGTTSAVSTNIPDSTGYPDVPGYPVTPGVPGYPVTPDVPQNPTVPDTPQTPDGPSETPDTPKNPDDVAAFQDKTAPKLTVSTKNKSSRVSFQWDAVAGADGYQIYRYDAQSKKYTRMKTIAEADRTTYSKAMEYATAYKFRVRAFDTSADGTRIYGKFSSYVKVTTAPAKVAKLSVSQQKTGKAVLKWETAQSVEGYQIYRSTKKNGTYTRVKTVKNGNTGKYSEIIRKRGKTCYYKVRAYVTQADGTRRYGSFSNVKKLATR